MTEREQIVRYLRAKSSAAAEMGTEKAWTMHLHLNTIANAIERGDHLGDTVSLEVVDLNGDAAADWWLKQRLEALTGSEDDK